MCLKTLPFRGTFGPSVGMLCVIMLDSSSLNGLLSTKLPNLRGGTTKRWKIETKVCKIHAASQEKYLLWFVRPACAYAQYEKNHYFSFSANSMVLSCFKRLWSECMNAQANKRFCLKTSFLAMPPRKNMQTQSQWYLILSTFEITMPHGHKTFFMLYKAE